MIGTSPGTTGGLAVSSEMIDIRKLWLVYNSASGSNDPESLAALKQAFDTAGIAVDREFRFPDDPAPAQADLVSAGVDCLAIFAGDGTISTILRDLAGWHGKALVLPGGTMNMLSGRVHGDDVGADEIVARLGGTDARIVRPPVIQTRHGIAFTGVTAGPGTAWNHVREALREAKVVDMVTTAAEAIGESTGGARVRCLRPKCGIDGGYPAITVTPETGGLEVMGYVAESLGDYAGQAVAILQRDFRKGPSEALGIFAEVRLGGVEGEPMGLLIDGEPFDGDGTESFSLARCEFDLIATADTAARDA